MVAIMIVAIGVLVGVMLVNSPAKPQPVPPQQETTTTTTQQPDCGCGVPSSPRGPR